MRLFLFSLLVLPVADLASAGVVFEIESQDYDFNPPRIERTTVSAEGAALKMESTQGQRGSSDAMIFRGDRSEMIVVDHERRSYMVIDKQFATNMMNQIHQAAGQMQGMLDNVPAEQRAMVEQMMKTRGAQGQTAARPPAQTRNTGQQQQVYGYPCVLFEVTREGRKIRDVWVTNWNNIEGARDLAATFNSMSDFVQEITSAFPAQSQNPMQDNAFVTIKQMGGFPVATREYREDGTVESETALRSAQSQRLNPAELQPPTGYQLESMPGGAMPGAGAMGAPSLGRASTANGRYGQGGR